MKPKHFLMFFALGLIFLALSSPMVIQRTEASETTYQEPVSIPVIEGANLDEAIRAYLKTIVLQLVPGNPEIRIVAQNGDWTYGQMILPSIAEQTETFDYVAYKIGDQRWQLGIGGDANFETLAASAPAGFVPAPVKDIAPRATCTSSPCTLYPTMDIFVTKGPVTNVVNRTMLFIGSYSSNGTVYTTMTGSRTLLHFGTINLPAGARATSATLQLWRYALGYSCSADRPAYVQRITSSWNESRTTYPSSEGNYGAFTFNCGVPTETETARFQLNPDLINNYLRTANNGILVRMKHEGFYDAGVAVCAYKWPSGVSDPTGGLCSNNYPGRDPQLKIVYTFDPMVAPSNLVATTVSTSQVDLTWNDNDSTESNYIVQYRYPGETTWKDVATLPANSKSYSVTNLGCGSSIEYRVRAYRSSDNSYIGSNVATQSTLLCAPLNLAVTGTTPDSASLSWSDLNSETKYFIERYPDSTNASQWGVVGETAQDVTTFVDTTLACTETYSYRVRGFRDTDSIYSAYSATLDNVTAQDCAPPALPTNFTLVSATQNQFYLSWQDNSDNEDNFRVEYKLSSSESWTELTSAANTTTYAITGLSCGLPYDVRMRAYKTTPANYSSYVNLNEAGTWTSDCDPVPPPTGGGSDGGTQEEIPVIWDDNASDEAGYIIEYSLDEINWTEVTAPADSTSYTLTGLTCGTPYYVRIKAFRTARPTYSETVNVNPYPVWTADCDPSTPPSLFTSPGDRTQTDINLSWVDNSSDEESFIIEYSLDGVDWTELSAPANSTSYSLTDLQCGTQYYVRIKTSRSTRPYYSTAVNLDPYPIWTADCDPLEAPTNVVPGDITDTQIDIGWSNGATNAESIVIEYSLNGVDGWTELTTSATSTTYSLTGLQCGTDYYVRIKTFRTAQPSYSTVTNLNPYPVTTAPCASVTPTPTPDNGSGGTDPTPTPIPTIPDVLSNGGFEGEKVAGVPIGWVGKGTKIVPKDKQKCNKPEKNKYISNSGDCAFMFKGNPTGEKTKINQKITDVSLFPNGAIVTLSVMVDKRSSSVGHPIGKLIVKYTNNEKDKLLLRIPDASGYTEISQSVTINTSGRDLWFVKVQFRNKLQGGKFFIDDAKLLVDSAGALLNDKMPLPDAPDGFRD